MGPEDQVILVTHQPRWLMDWFWAKAAAPNLRQLVRGHLRGRARVHLAGLLPSRRLQQCIHSWHAGFQSQESRASMGVSDSCMIATCTGTICKPVWEDRLVINEVRVAETWFSISWVLCKLGRLEAGGHFDVYTPASLATAISIDHRECRLSG